VEIYHCLTRGSSLFTVGNAKFTVSDVTVFHHAHPVVSGILCQKLKLRILQCASFHMEDPVIETTMTVMSFD
jgi:hypothetical protein